MENLRFYTFDDLNYYKDTLDKILKEKIPNFNHTLIKEAPNPWGWSPLADIQIFIKPCIIYTVKVLYCGSVTCLDAEINELVKSWLSNIETEETRIQQRNDTIKNELALSAFVKTEYRELP